ncbi:MAG: ATP-binding protein [Gammaproteobacteria bacterium]|nr:ATP-binding protein [Gammaproteobacteria bacterium]
MSPLIRFSLEGKLLALALSVALAAVVSTALLTLLLGSLWLGAVAAFAVSLPLAWLGARRFAAPIARLIRALGNGVANLRDGDFSIGIASARHDELGDLVDTYNALVGVLREERRGIHQRELLLDTVIQRAPIATVLTAPGDVVIYSNLAARHLLYQGRKLEGARFAAVLDAAPRALRDVGKRHGDGLLTTVVDGERQTWHYSHRQFTLNARPHELYMIRQLTRELGRQEAAIWKKVIRVIGHEINNSLAPIVSLAHSGRQIVREKGDIPDFAAGRVAKSGMSPFPLEAIFSTIEERSAYLRSFIDGYARFAKLPQPRIEAVDWRSFVDSLGRTLPFRLRGALPEAPAHFDPAQMQQVLINLLKNAHESGSPADGVELEIATQAAGASLRVLDRGHGMSGPVLDNALLPFYSTKQTGTGLGLPLCREIVEAHGGRLQLANRREGGVAVTLWLPVGSDAQPE